MRAIACALLAVTLTGCATGTISFRREDMAFMISDERDRYNRQVEFVNRACLAGALSVQDCQFSADDAKEAVKQYLDLRARLLAKEAIDAESILRWLLTIGAALGRIYGIPIPSPQGFVARPAVPLLPRMP